MRTSYQTAGDKSYFILSDLDPQAQEGARNLAFTPYKDKLARVYPADTPHLDVFYRQFAHVAEEMLLQRAGARPVFHG